MMIAKTSTFRRIQSINTAIKITFECPIKWRSVSFIWENQTSFFLVRGFFSTAQKETGLVILISNVFDVIHVHKTITTRSLAFTDSFFLFVNLVTVLMKYVCLHRVVHCWVDWMPQRAAGKRADRLSDSNGFRQQNRPCPDSMPPEQTQHFFFHQRSGKKTTTSINVTIIKWHIKRYSHLNRTTFRSQSIWTRWASNPMAISDASITSQGSVSRKSQSRFCSEFYTIFFIGWKEQCSTTYKYNFPQRTRQAFFTRNEHKLTRFLFRNSLFANGDIQRNEQEAAKKKRENGKNV